MGESGCGKTTLGRAIVKLVEPTAGSILVRGRGHRAIERGGIARAAAEVPDDFPGSVRLVEPAHDGGSEIIGEAIDIHKLAESRPAREKRIVELLKAVGLDAAHAQRYPHEFSGGQRQRIGIARALAVEPKLIVCDEPVSALDVSVQAQIINLLQDLQQQRGIAYLFIAHDLAVVEHISRRVMVMYLGKVVELAEAKAIIRAPKHPYTQALISAVPVVDPDSKRQADHSAGRRAVADPSAAGLSVSSALSASQNCRDARRRFRRCAKCRRGIGRRAILRSEGPANAYFHAAV